MKEMLPGCAGPRDVGSAGAIPTRLVPGRGPHGLWERHLRLAGGDGNDVLPGGAAVERSDLDGGNLHDGEAGGTQRDVPDGGAGAERFPCGSFEDTRP